ncbi:hypothetical protein EDD27_10498 [Nonomuraea polychroma]|uniref:Uncharacterized protein n=2 Tax=Nonomuraea polychroma TaxID=46176 RepID=A0A438MQ24_9ACTN|nr:hypothetical protein EDD27_10498 [Nonomuraea polychroma]
MTVLLLSVAALIAYHLASWSPAGWIWPISAAYFTAATTRHFLWVIGIGIAQLVYSAIDAQWILDHNIRRYLFHTLGETLLLAILIGAGLAHAAAQRWHRQQANP